MMLFVVDQIAGAEYISPLLRKWMSEGRSDWTVLSTGSSSACLAANRIPFELVEKNCGEDEVANRIARIAPDRALLSTSVPNDLEHRFLQVLLARNIPVAQLVDHWMNPRVRFDATRADGVASLLLPDCILTLDDDGRQRLVAEGIPIENVRIIGQPHWEACWRKSLDQPMARDERNLALMISQPISKFYGRDWGYDEKDFTRCCLEAWQAAGLDPSRLHLLLHPAEAPDAAMHLRDRDGNAITVVPNADLRLAQYSLVLGMSSSMLAQGLLEGVPAVSVQPGAIGPDQCVFSERGFIPRVLSSEELARYLMEVWTSTDGPTASEPIGRMVDGSLARLEEWISTFAIAR